MPTIYEATENGPVVCRIEGDAQLYRFQRQEPGMTLSMFAGGTAVKLEAGNYVDADGVRGCIRNWSTPVTVV